jgi:hypothetical protein
MPNDVCPCGRPLHYRAPGVQAYVESLIHDLGSDIEVATPDGTFLVPRHYIALHGISARTLRAVAAQYSWKEVTRDDHD